MAVDTEYSPKTLTYCVKKKSLECYGKLRLGKIQLNVNEFFKK